MGKSSACAVCLSVPHPLVLQELSHLLAGQSFRLLTWRLDPTAMADRSRLRIPRASVYVVDIPASLADGEFLVSEILVRVPRARVLVIADRLDEASAFAFLRLGAKGFLRYADVKNHLVPAIEALAVGGFWAPRTLLSRFIDKTLRRDRKPAIRPANANLSRREREVLELLLQNYSNKEIASQLHISSRTAKFHVSNLLAKYGVNRRADLLLMRLA